MKGGVFTQEWADKNNAKVVAGRNGGAPEPDKKKPRRNLLQAELALNATPSVHVDKVKGALERRKGEGVYG